MHNPPAHDDETKPTGGNRRRVLIVVAVIGALAVMVVLHLTGTIGANNH
jgi:hypothetical protein